MLRKFSAVVHFESLTKVTVFASAFGKHPNNFKRYDDIFFAPLLSNLNNISILEYLSCTANIACPYLENSIKSAFQWPGLIFYLGLVGGAMLT